MLLKMNKNFISLSNFSKIYLPLTKIIPLKFVHKVFKKVLFQPTP